LLYVAEAPLSTVELAFLATADACELIKQGMRGAGGKNSMWSGVEERDAFCREGALRRGGQSSSKRGAKRFRRVSSHLPNRQLLKSADGENMRKR
jgi:hypothetical protein